VYRESSEVQYSYICSGGRVYGECMVSIVSAAKYSTCRTTCVVGVDWVFFSGCFSVGVFQCMFSVHVFLTVFLSPSAFLPPVLHGRSREDPPHHPRA
jgi:hypothetical protein